MPWEVVDEDVMFTLALTGEPQTRHAIRTGLGDGYEGLVSAQGDSVGEIQTVEKGLECAIRTQREEPSGPGMLHEVQLVVSQVEAGAGDTEVDRPVFGDGCVVGDEKGFTFEAVGQSGETSICFET